LFGPSIKNNSLLEIQKTYLSKINSEREEIKHNINRVFNARQQVLLTEKKSRHFLSDALQEIQLDHPKQFQQLLSEAKSKGYVDGRKLTLGSMKAQRAFQTEIHKANGVSHERNVKFFVGVKPT